MSRRAVVLIVIAFIAPLLVRTFIVQTPSRWPFEFLRPKIEEFAGREKTGEVVFGRPEMSRRPPETFADHLVIQGDRFVRFFQFTSSGFSRIHNVVNVAYYVPLYLLGVAGAAHGLRGADEQRRSLVIVTLLWIGWFAFVHALTILDYPWRYRVPLLPHFMVLAACGVDAMAGRLARGGAYAASR